MRVYSRTVVGKARHFADHRSKFLHMQKGYNSLEHITMQLAALMYHMKILKIPRLRVYEWSTARVCVRACSSLSLSLSSPPQGRESLSGWWVWWVWFQLPAEESAVCHWVNPPRTVARDASTVLQPREEHAMKIAHYCNTTPTPINNSDFVCVLVILSESQLRSKIKIVKSSNPN